MSLSRWEAESTDKSTNNCNSHRYNNISAQTKVNVWNESKLHWRQQHTGFSRLFNALITLKQDSIKPASMQSCFELLVYKCSYSSVISVAAGITGRQRQLGCALVSKSSIFQVPCLCSFILFPPLERRHFRQ